jgi:phosphoribosylaminoimidazolecarboxamide formyltransferase/IMP cyclohydrolase
MDPDHVPPGQEVRDVFGVRIVQATDPITLDERTLGKAAGTLPEALRKDVLLGLITVRHAQSNSVAYVSDGSTIGVGTGQQSRVDCVKLAGEKADRWRLLRHPRLATTRFPSGMSIQDRVNASIRLAEDQLSETEKQQWLVAAAPCTIVSDAYLPFRDNVDVAARHGAGCIVEGGGSRRSEEIEEACREHNIVLIRTGLRLFCH